MVRNYKHKKIKSYTANELEIAATRISKGELTIGAASREFKIPKATLRDNVKLMKTGCKIKKVGRSSVLSEEEESLLAHALVYLSECGHPQDRGVLQELVRTFLVELGRKNPFKVKFAYNTFSIISPLIFGIEEK